MKTKLYCASTVYYKLHSLGFIRNQMNWDASETNEEKSPLRLKWLGTLRNGNKRRQQVI